jgi:hypothetical protein
VYDDQAGDLLRHRVQDRFDRLGVEDRHLQANIWILFQIKLIHLITDINANINLFKRDSAPMCSKYLKILVLSLLQIQLTNFSKISTAQCCKLGSSWIRYRHNKSWLDPDPKNTYRIWSQTKLFNNKKTAPVRNAQIRRRNI